MTVAPRKKPRAGRTWPKPSLRSVGAAVLEARESVESDLYDLSTKLDELASRIEDLEVQQRRLVAALQRAFGGGK